ncbi:hypothetical protein XA68_17591 [Ophiocordyceps unilateralis]|uniref:LRR-containing protein second PH domain-containing protein n=1 Tax=Ophiocordyceps unilateralis TaxID=268505 RepID=A0A2A9PKA6_OPHUN|nr:hypothetical protein XA68_17591 [Ophiocordyceps unilateralis]
MLWPSLLVFARNAPKRPLNPSAVLSPAPAPRRPHPPALDRRRRRRRRRCSSACLVVPNTSLHHDLEQPFIRLQSDVVASLARHLRKWRSSSGLFLGPPLGGQQAASDKRMKSEPAGGKTPRAFTRALRSLSSSSMDSMAATSIRSSSSTRRLQKTPSNAGSMIERFHRRVSRDSSANGSVSESPGNAAFDGCQPYSTMAVLQYGPLKADVSLLKARSEYLVLTDQCLVKFAGGEAARNAFPQLDRARAQARDASPHRHAPGRSASGDARLDIPLHAMVAAFVEDTPTHRSGIEVWWFSAWPRLGYCRAHLHFALSRERDDWLASIHRAYRAKLRKGPAGFLIPDNLKVRVDHIVRANEGLVDEAPEVSIFPVARRVFGSHQKQSSADEAHDNADSSSFYFVIGPCMCHFIEVLKADHSTLPGDLRVKATSHGTVTLTRFKASVASHEQRFVVCFRSPFGPESRLDLASVQYRRVIEALTKADRILKPMWPQHFQQVIFDIRGLPPPLQLTSGNDLGGLKRSLQAYCAAYKVQVPEWKIEWNTAPQPAFRLLPLDGERYSSLQLLAVFRALRYNSFFKAISFRGVDLSPLAGKTDHSQYGDAVAYRSLNGLSISEDRHEVLLQAPILEREMHALTFASESIRSIDMTEVLGDWGQNRSQCDFGSLRSTTSELLRPMLMLWKQQLCVCHSISLSGNPLGSQDVDELANLIEQGQVHFKKLHLARCALGDSGLLKLWKGLAGQAHSLESLDTSDNQGSVRFEMIQSTLRRMRRLTRLVISGNTRIASDGSLLDEATMSLWALEELDLSGIPLNDDTVNVLASYLGSEQSQDLRAMRLNNCGLTGRQISRVFRGMGQARRLTLHLGGNRLDEGIDDLCGAIACGYGPWSLFLQMVEFAREINYIKLLRALTVNKTVECLSLAGTAMSDAASSTACQAVADFFSKNNTVRFLDISGYDSKLDEGRLGKEFSRALGGMRRNTRIEHLRVRSQMLNVNIGDLAEAISANKAMLTLDCEGNDFNLSNFRHLIRKLQDNSTIRHFSAFSDQELSRTIRKSVLSADTDAPARRQSVMAKFLPDKSQAGKGKLAAQQLQDQWDCATADLERTLARNRGMFEDREQARSGFSRGAGRRDSDAESDFMSAFGGLARRDWDMRRANGCQGSTSPTRQAVSELAAQAVAEGSREDLNRPMSMASCDVAVSPSTDGASTSDAPSPPELESPAEGGFVFEDGRSVVKVLDEARDGIWEGCDVEGGLQMKRYRRLVGQSTNRIEEETEMARKQLEEDC